jgi:hypothetical protein
MNFKSILGKGTATAIMTLILLLGIDLNYPELFIWFNCCFIFATYYAKYEIGVIRLLTKYGED